MNIHSRVAGVSAKEIAKLRLDIQALRGLAVLLVVLYHAGVDFVPAGYLGVDVFFVISGFLITSLIARAIDRGDFSFPDFYYRRAKRLLPAAYVVILATVVAAPFFISDLAFEEMKAQVWGAVTFTSNFVLWGQVGYFDGGAETKPFLHFWSLAIEEQYYLVMPLLLVLLPRRLWVPALTVVLVTSLTASVWLAQLDSSAAFYLSPTRAWELAIGSLIAIAPVDRIPLRVRSFSRLPAILVLLVVPAFPTGLPHPSLDALLVTVATALVIIGMSGARIEQSAPVRGLAWIGDFSYSLYLVHWPVMVFTRAAWLEHAPNWAMYVAVGISVALSYALYRFVEEPFRHGFKKGRAILAGGLAAASVCAAFAPMAVASATTSEKDFADIRRNNYGLHRSCAFGERYPFTGDLPEACRTQPNARILVWGDSYAMAWTSALMGPLAEFGLEQATRGRCDPLLGMSRYPANKPDGFDSDYAKSCIDLHKQILEYAVNRDQLEIVALAGRFATILSTSNIMVVETAEGYAEEQPSLNLAATGLANLAIRLREAGKRVVILAPPPADGSQIGDCLERQAKGKITFGPRASCDLARADVDETRAEVRQMLDLAAERAGVPIVDISDFLCDETVCRTSIEGKFIYRDSGHLAYEGAAIIGERSGIAERILAEAR